MATIKNRKLFFAILICFISPLISQAGDWDSLYKLYKEKNFSKVIEIGLTELKANKKNHELNMIVGRAYTESHQFKEAIPYLTNGIQQKGNMNWISGWSYAYLGKCYIFTDQVKKSKESYKNCVQLNATKNSTKSAKKSLEFFQMTPFFDSWEIKESEHIRFHFQASEKMKNIDEFIKSRETAYRKINKFFETTPYKKIDFFVWENPEEAEEMYGRSLGWASVNSSVINSRKNQTTGHEITHILVGYGIRASKVCSFINEGLAVYFDQSNRDRIKIAKESLNGKQFDIIKHWNNSFEEVSDFDYTVGGAFIEYLFETRSNEEIKLFLKNQTIENAKIIFLDFDKSIANFEEKLNNKKHEK